MIRSFLLFGASYLAAGCASADMALTLDAETAGANGAESDAATDADVQTHIRFDVLPPSDLRADVDFAPQTFLRALDGAPLSLDLGEPLQIDGVVRGYAVTPYPTFGFGSPELPGQESVLAGVAVSIRTPLGLQSANALTGEDGSFALEVPADAGYRLSVVTENPWIPFRTAEFPVDGDATLDIDLGAGVAVWGRVLDGEGVPMAGAWVRAVDAWGVPGPAVRAGADGFYTLRVDPGSYDLVCEGRRNGRDPNLRSTGRVVGTEGLSQDFVFSDLRLTSVSGRVLDASGRPIAQAEVHFVSTALSAYPATAESRSSFEVTVATNAAGNFDTRLLPGVYETTIQSPASVAATAISERIEVGSTLLDLGTRALPDFAAMQARFLDLEGNVVPGALVSFAQSGFPGRRWDAVADATGTVRALLPNAALEATLTPPAQREDLALTLLPVTPAGDVVQTWSFAEGVWVEGVVRFPSADGVLVPARSALVRAIAEDGSILGIRLTDASGRFGFTLRDVGY